MEPEETGRRIRALRALTAPNEEELAARRETTTRDLIGLTRAELAQRIDRSGYGAKTIGSMERGEAGTPGPKLSEIAEACGMPKTFFTFDFTALDGADPSRVDELTETVARTQEQLTALDNYVKNVIQPLVEGRDEGHTTEPAGATAPSTPRTASRGRNRRRPAP